VRLRAVPPSNDGHPLLHPVPVMEDVEEEYFDTEPAGRKQYGLRYDQFDRLVNYARWLVYRGELKWSPLQVQRR
jgi:hypothetical protein